ncbi:hypothetical protein M885DRAFT_456002 [Pelagophyceae sp. CCMP2097]|nr:hypothetical protein M885DRAFT_456002 [Pelagophyceae sp. CCMP2097]
MTTQTFWVDTLRSPRRILAPMVGQSELAFRVLARSCGADVCYTEMLHADRFVNEPSYREEHFETNAEDRPLIVQFCGHDARVLLSAARIVEGDCDAVELNCGCPQRSASNAGFGAFLAADAIVDIVRLLSSSLSVAVVVKMRLRESVEATVRLAQAVQGAGCAALTVHCRTRHQRRGGPCDWDALKRVCEAVSIPVVANGGIEKFSDFEECLATTGADAIMSGESALENVSIFNGTKVTPAGQVQLALKYLGFAVLYKARPAVAQEHLRTMLHFCPKDDQDALAKAETLESLRRVIEDVAKRVARDPRRNEPARETWYRRHRSKPSDVSAFCASHPDASVVAATGHVRCEATGHEMAPQLSVLEAHWAGKAYGRAAKRLKLTKDKGAS